MSAFLGDVNSKQWSQKSQDRKLGETWTDWRAFEKRKDMRSNPGSASIPTVLEILWIKCEQKMRSKRNRLHLARLQENQKSKKQFFGWNLLGVVNWLLGQKYSQEYCKAKTECVPFHFTYGWHAFKEQSFLSQRFLKTFLEVITTWKILFWYCCLSWLHSIGKFDLFLNSVSLSLICSCVLLANLGIYSFTQ